MKILKLLFLIGFVVSASLSYLYGIIGLHTYPRTAGVQTLPTAVPKEPSVLILGTSLSSKGGWVDQLVINLRECGVTVGKLARPGASSKWGLGALTKWYEDGNSAGLVILEFSGNDASLKNGMPLFVSRGNHTKIIDLAYKNGSIVSVATMSPGWGINALERPGQNRYHALYRELSVIRGLGLIDSIDLWRELSADERFVMVPDDLHPTTQTAQKITLPLFEDHIRRIFCK